MVSKKFPTSKDDSSAFMEAADERMEQIRELGAKPSQRYFGVGPKKSLSSAEKTLQGQLSQKHLEYYNKGMQKQRLEKGLTRMKGGKEVNR